MNQSLMSYEMLHEVVTSDIAKSQTNVFIQQFTQCLSHYNRADQDSGTNNAGTLFAEGALRAAASDGMGKCKCHRCEKE